LQRASRLESKAKGKEARRTGAYRAYESKADPPNESRVQTNETREERRLSEAREHRMLERKPCEEALRTGKTEEHCAVCPFVGHILSFFTFE
jgi:hypothetical protein